jgi:hypothetical protein
MTWVAGRIHAGCKNRRAMLRIAVIGSSSQPVEDALSTEGFAISFVYRFLAVTRITIYSLNVRTTLKIGSSGVDEWPSCPGVNRIHEEKA